MSPFNDSYYRKLLKGQEITELKLSQLENQLTLGAEYYSKQFINVVNKIKTAQVDFSTLSSLTKLITDGDHGATQYQDRGILYLLSESIKEGYIDTSVGTRYISKKLNKELKRSELHPGDIVVTKTGVYFGKSSVIPKDILIANTSAHVAKISPVENVNPYYLSTFLNSNMGYSQLRRRGIKVSRPEIKLVEFKDILISIPSYGFQKEIEKLIVKAQDFLFESRQAYKESELILLREIGLENFYPNSTGINVKSFSRSFAATGRLDAEYYQLKYDMYLQKITEYEYGCNFIKKVCQINSRNYKPKGDIEYKYIELSDIGKFGEITGCTFALGDDLPTRARRIVEEGDVIISSIEGSLDSCGLVNSNFNNALCSTGFYIIKSNKINSETLLVLFKSELMQNLLKQNCSGTILTGLNKDDFYNIPIPLIDIDVQERIRNLINESFKLKKHSEHLLEIAKIAVEVAVDVGEQSALNYINQNS